MNRIHIRAVLALSVFAATISTAFAQRIFSPSSGGVSPTATQGTVLGGAVEMCQAAPGGSRVRQNCEPLEERPSKSTQVAPSAPPKPLLQCEAATATEYSQQNDVARVAGTISTRNCPAGTTGFFALVARIKDASGEIKPLEFSETWERDDAQDVIFTRDYPIGDNVELVSVRLRDLVCTCAATPPPVPEPAAE